jgi:hypothetical protein
LTEAVNSIKMSRNKNVGATLIKIPENSEIFKR